MGLTREQARMCGIEHLYPDPGSTPVPSPVVVSASKRARIPNVNASGQNKTEARFHACLLDLQVSRQIEAFAFESIKLRLAGRTWYAPDFAVARADGRIALIEVKGFMRDDAAVKLKVAAEKYKTFAFFVAFADRRGFDVRRVTPSGGIGRTRIERWWEDNQ